MSGEGGEAILPSDLGLALNGNIVALVQVGDLDPHGSVYDPDLSTPALEEMSYLGLALVRGLRRTPPNSEGEQGYTLHLLTPLPEEVLARANCIIRNGAVELPLCGMLDWRAPNAPDLAGVKWEDVPYLDVSGVVGVGGERRRFRRNLMRKGQ
jgi:polynucleotide 5'-hydroxyl-kinase GRC3/NOL9